LNRLDILKDLINKSSEASDSEDEDCVFDADGKIAKFHDAFEALVPIVEGIFGNALDPLWEVHLTNFEAAYDALGISRTTKVIQILQHTSEFALSECKHFM
jgi:hypothetical protein